MEDQVNALFRQLTNSMMLAREYITHNVFHNVAWKRHMHDITNIAGRVSEYVRRMDPNQKMSFVETHYGGLYKVYDTMLGPFAKMYIPSHISLHRSALDKFFNGIGIRRPSSYFLGFPSRLFNEFVKGITYFDGEDTEYPIYHRDSSCGRSDMTWIEKFMIQPTDTPKTIRRKQAALRKCYIERLIFDQIYSHVLHEQNMGHHMELRYLERYFQDTHHEAIHVSVTFDAFYYPIALDIVANLHGNRVKIIESYRKAWGDVRVTCEKTETRPRTIHRYRKSQTFSGEASWVSVV